MSNISFKNNGLGADGIDRRLSIAPMMDWTDRHCRYFHRLLCPSALLFTEMVTAEAILHAGAARFCAHHSAEHPLALQLGGSNPDRLAQAVEAVEAFGFDEINLNVGCPSPRVQSGRFGACLMEEPELVAQSIKAMANATDRPVTVKCRIGIDDMDIEHGLDDFVDAVADAGVKVIYLHARKAWLNGLSPKENREIPPLNYDRAARLAMRRGDLDIILNGGLTSVTDITDAMQGNMFSGVMIGRAAYKTPLILRDLAQSLFGDSVTSLDEIATKMTAYADKEMKQGCSLHAITRHMLGISNAMRGGRHFRRFLGEGARDKDVTAELIRHSFDALITAQEKNVA